jgi:amino acid adenylation domain-containing protein
MIAILGVLKAGAPYVPLDPAHAPDRLDRMLGDSTAQVVVGEPRTSRLAHRLAAGREVVLVEQGCASVPPTIAARPGDLAYVYYTSGSTGEPKGVMDTHRNVLHNVMRYTNGLHISPDDRLTLLQRPAFSGAVSSMFGALLNGAAVCPFDPGTEGPARLAEWLEEAGVTIYHSVPSVFRQLAARRPELPRLRAVRLEGDRAALQDVELFRDGFRGRCVLVNGLGLTETGLVRRFVVDRTTELRGPAVPVGYAVDDMEIVLLDEGGRPVSEGDVGEIAVRSRYLSPGYWQRPELTATRFRRDPCNGESRTYLTGDLGRMLPGGCLVHLGRSDFQIKVRGQRVELDEVEGAVLADPAVDAVAITANGDRDDLRLTAHIVPAGACDPNVSALRRRLSERLPEASVPSRFVVVESLPVNENGKIDLRALSAAPNGARPLLDEPYAPPRTPLEQTLADVWAEVLGVEPVGIRDGFADLGGDSLVAATLLTRLEEQLGRPVPFSVLAATRTVEELAVGLAEAEAAPDPPIVQIAGGEGAGRPFVFVHGDYVGGALYCWRLAAELGRDFYAVTPHGLRGDPVPPTIEAMAADRAAHLREVLPSGPYLVGGHCQPGGLVALEMARILEDAGEPVELVLVGTTPRNTRFPFRQPARAASSLVSAGGRVAGLDHECRDELFWLVRSTVHALGNGSPRPPRAPTSAAWTRALLTHVPRRYPRRLTLLWPSDEPTDAQAARRRWRRIGVQANVHAVPGDHLTAVTTHVTALSAALRRVLDEADQASSATS